MPESEVRDIERKITEFIPFSGERPATKGKIEAFEDMLVDLAERYHVSTTKIARILLDHNIRSIYDLPDEKRLDTIIREGLKENSQYSTTVNPKLTEEQLAYDREPIPFTPVKRLQRDDILYVTEETRPHPIEGYHKSHKEYAVIDLRGYRRGYEPKLEIKGIYTPNPRDIFRLHDGHLPPYQPITTGDKLLGEMRRLSIHSASRISPAGAISAQTRKYWVLIDKPGDSYFTEGTAVPYEEFEEERNKIIDRGGKLPTIRIRLELPSGNGNGDKQLPATVEAEPVPEKYRWLIPFIGDEPLPPEANILLPAVEVVEGERKIDVVLKRLAEGVEGIQDSTQFRLFLTTMAKFHDYSYANQILIMLQRPSATRVAGFVTWKDLGRWVKKGESGIAILAPVFPPKPKKDAGEEEEEKEIPLTPVYFRVVHVFDISQTDGKPLPEFEVPVLTGEANEELFSKIMAMTKAQGLDVSFEPRPYLEPSVKGQYSPPRSIWVRPEESRAQQLKTLLHEVAHYYSEGVLRIPRRDAETIAESAAFVVGAHYGFDSGVRTFPYVALWAQDKKTLAKNLKVLRSVADTMLHTLEGTPKGSLLPDIEIQRYYWVEKNEPYESWAIVEAWPGGNVRSPFSSKEDAIKREKEIAADYEWMLKQVPSPQEKYPKQHEALKKAYPYIIVEYHDDGDLTIRELVSLKKGRGFDLGKLYVVTTDGQVFEETQLAMTLAKTEGDPISRFCCRFGDACAPPELLEEGRFLERISWLRHHYKEKHPGMWGHMPQTEEWLKSLTPEQEELLRETNKRISRLTTYGVRTEKIQKVPVRSLIWSNGSAAWYQGDTISDQYAAAFERFAQSPEYKRLPGDVVPTAPGYPKGAFCKAGETVRLDANEILVYGEEKDVRAILSELNPLPLYKYSTEAGMRGFGTQPPPESKHWTWPPIYEKDKQPTVEYLPDSAEFLAQTIIATGYREKLDKAFQEAIARVRYGSA